MFDYGEDEISIFVYWLWRFFMKTFYFIFYIPVLCLSWGKGKTVPSIKNDLLLKSATQLAEEIRCGKLKSEEVVQAYIERIQEVEPFINTVVQNCFEEAILKSKEVDAFISAGGIDVEQLRREKPLLGVPFTVKMLLKVKGLKCSAGFALLKDRVADEDAPTVAQVRNAGGIFLALTNAPPFGFALETYNHLHGITRNPYDTHRTPGGSSGGESALLAAAGSVIGLANDIGGSIRIPAHCTGIFSHKPSRDLVSNEGGCVEFNPRIKSCLSTGPMCRYAEDLITMMNVLTSENKDRIEFNRTVNFKSLKIYYQLSNMDPRVEPVHEEIKTAMKRAINYFREKYNVTATEVNMKLLNITSYIATPIMNDNMPDFARECTAGKLDHCNEFLELLKYCCGKSDFTFSTLLNLLLLKSPLVFREKDVPRARQLLQKMKRDFDSILDENSVFFYPTTSSASRLHYEMITLMYNSIYTVIFNLLGLPVTQCPLGFNKSGLPHGMQIVGKLNNDPLTIACAIELGKHFGGWIPPS